MNEDCSRSYVTVRPVIGRRTTMSIRRILAIAMAVLLVGLPTAAAAQQSVIGSISGSIDAKTVKAGSYTVRVRDVMSGQVVKSEPLNPQGQFSFTQLPLGQR